MKYNSEIDALSRGGGFDDISYSTSRSTGSGTSGSYLGLLGHGNAGRLQERVLQTFLDKTQ